MIAQAFRAQASMEGFAKGIVSRVGGGRGSIDEVFAVTVYANEEQSSRALVNCHWHLNQTTPGRRFRVTPRQYAGEVSARSTAACRRDADEYDSTAPPGLVRRIGKAVGSTRCCADTGASSHRSACAPADRYGVNSDEHRPPLRPHRTQGGMPTYSVLATRKPTPVPRTS